MKIKVKFDDAPSGSIIIPSTWSQKKREGMKSISCQTPDQFYEQKEMFTQSGEKTSYVQDDVEAKDVGKSLVEVLLLFHIQLQGAKLKNR